jgi:mono/diheme cytochrome c family protein
MSFARRHTVPIAAGLSAAVSAFAVVALTSDDGGGQAPESGRGATARAGSASAHAQADGLAVFTRMGCGGCHRLAAASSSGPIGPDLNARLPDHTRESLTAAILSPPPNAAMPSDFGDRLSDAELAALVGFLLSVRGPR